MHFRAVSVMVVAVWSSVALTAPTTDALRKVPLRRLHPVYRRQVNCLDDTYAQMVANNFAALIRTYSDALADAALTVNFTDYSSSVNTLINNGTESPIPLLDPTFISREQFKAGQSTQPSIDFQQLNIWHTCTQVILRWMSAQDPQPIVGIIVLDTVAGSANSSYPFLIDLVYSEFNSAAWLVDLGVFVPTT